MMEAKIPESLSFDDFQAVLAELLQVGADRLGPETYFITDLGMDSLKLAALLLRLEDLGVDLTPDLIWQIATVGDAYRIYQEVVSR
jgi:acyl carrier protein